jgi:NAD(P)H-hydrate epimerase
MENTLQLPILAPRAADSNKGMYGTVLAVGGSYGMSGAAVLMGSAALRGGAGLVRVATPELILPIVAAANPCYTTIPLPHDDHGRLSLSALGRILAEAKEVDVVAMGPGIGRGGELPELVGQFVEQVPVPLVLDADGLNAVAGQVERLRRHGAPLVITPHPGEFARLVRKDTKAVQSQRIELAAAFAQEHNCVVVLKGFGTVVTDGSRIYRNATGNPGMSTGGTGDILTGLIAALIGQGLEPFAAAQLGVHLHGLAGDLARQELGEVAMIATDLLDYLAKAFQEI